MNNDVTMINKEHETFQFTLLNNNIKDSHLFIYLSYLKITYKKKIKKIIIK
jgi:hypothetical protein